MLHWEVASLRFPVRSNELFLAYFVFATRVLFFGAFVGRMVQWGEVSTMRFLLSVLGIIAGFVVIRYAYPIKQQVGSLDWAEKMFGIGGTTTALQVIGLLLSICSFLWMTGTFDATLGLIFGGMK